jgi:predicted Zn-dependent peptidase
MPRCTWTIPLLLLLSPLTHAEEAPPAGPRLEIDAYRLPNGLKVALHRDPSVPRVVVCVAYHVGSRNERAGRTGFAHFFEHMMFRGTKNVPDYDVPLQVTGAQSNAFTSEDMTVYFEIVSSEYLERALYMEAERLAFLPSALDRAKFDTEREVVKNERRQGVDNVPYGQVEEALLGRLFPKGHPYSWAVIGSMKDLDAASLDDLKRFFAEFYAPANATLCLAGDFDPAEARSLIAKYFGPIRGGTPPAKSPAEPVPARPADLELADEVKLPRIHWAWPTVADDHPDAPALDLLAIVLAGGETSRLHRTLVRELRLSQDVSADSDTKEIGGHFTIESTAAEGKPPREIEQVFGRELARIKAEPPSAAELQRALARLETGQYAQLTRPIQRAIVISTGFAQKDDPEHYRKEYARYFRVTPVDIQRAAARYLGDAKVRLLVRPLRPGESKSTVEPAGPEPSTAPQKSNHSPPTGTGPSAAAGPDWSRMPGPARVHPFQPPRYERRSLAQGIELWASLWKTLPLVRLSLRVPMGTGDDPPGKAGLASLLTRLLDQGTVRRTATELAEEFERLGATVGASIGRDDTTVSVSVLARNLGPTLELLGEMLAEPRFDPMDFDRERSRQLADLLQGPDDVNWIARRALPIVMFGPGHPYGKPPEGSIESVKGLSLADVKALHRDRFGPRSATVIAAGDIDVDSLKSSLEQSLGTWKGASGRPSPRPEDSKPPESGVIHLVDKPGAVQSVLSVGRHWTERRDPRYPATLVGNHLFGGDFLGRLNKNLRVDHGYSYGAYSAFSFRRGRSVWQSTTAVRADATVPALREIFKEIESVAGPRPITPEEIEKAKSAEARSFPADFESPSGILAALTEIAEYGLPADYLDRFLPDLERVALPDVQRSMAEVLAPSERYVLVVGDAKSLVPELKKAGFDRVRRITYDGKTPGLGTR